MMLGYVSPCPTAKQVFHAAMTNTVFPGEIRRGHIALGVVSPSVNNFFLGEFCVRMILTPLMAFLGYFIRHVVGARTQEMMRWVAAWRVVTVMADYKSIRDRAIRQFIGNAMGRKRLTTTANMDSPIAHWVGASLPVPAIIGAENVNMRPESFCIGTKAGIMPVDKPEWFAFYVTAPVFISFRNGGFLSTSTMAIAVWDFSRGLSCGIITHVNSLLSAIGHSVGLFAQSPRFFVVSQVYCTISTLVNQVGLTV